MTKKTFLVDVDKCSGCDLCIVACKDEHVDRAYSPWTAPQPGTGHFWIDVPTLETGRLPRVRVSHLPLMCQHCENAACMKACPEDAIHRRDDGLVWIDPETCTGCGLCQEACPYGVIYMNDELDIAQKCTGCAHRVDVGLMPRCAEICPHDAIVFGDEDDDIFVKLADDGGMQVYHPEYQPEPRVFWKGLPQPRIAGSVIDATGAEVIIDATVTSTDLFDDTTVTVRTDAFGEFSITGLEDDHKYRLEVHKPGYERAVMVITTNGDQDAGDIPLRPSDSNV